MNMTKYLLLMTVTAILDETLLLYISAICVGIYYTELKAGKEQSAKSAAVKRRYRRQQIIQQESYQNLMKAS